MIVERSLHPQFLSNTYLLADEPGGAALFIDAGGPVAPLVEAAERLRLRPARLLLTHHHFDHVCEAAALRARWPELEVLIDPLELELLDPSLGASALPAGEPLQLGALELTPLRTPGHTAGMRSFLVAPRRAGEAAEGDGGTERSDGGTAESEGGTAEGDGGTARSEGGIAVFTGDTLFRGSVGGVRAPGHTSYADLRDSIMGTLMALAPATVIYPGHTDSTTVAREWQENPFIRIWRGVDPEGSRPCTALDQPATLILLGGDYDGGTKAWVRWGSGEDDIVPGSRVQL